MPETFPKSHLAQCNLKYLQVKPDLFFEFKDRRHNYNNYIKSPFYPRRMKPLRESTMKERDEEILILKEYNLNWKSNLYF